MIPDNFAAAIANHLWQSTVFAGAAGLLTLTLRQNHARTRYWLWLIASLKFLIPFSVLASVGSRFGWQAAARAKQPGFSLIMEEISRPFPQFASASAAAPVAPAAHASYLPAILLALWIAGFGVAVFSWYRGWRRMAAAARTATTLPIEAGIPVLSSTAMVEPGVFGIWRPVLMLPEGITERLKEPHLEAILAHELCHVSRRDNLAAAIHMAVEAIFWFHPLVWWVGARLVEERENACDEEVLRLGNRPEVYAESILKTCQFYLESPLVCMSGISGSDLKKRVTRIMTRQTASKLTFGRKLLLAVAGTAAIAGPIVFGLINAPAGQAQSPAAATTPAPAFEVVSIKPDRAGNGRTMISMHPNGRFTAENISLKFLLQEAYRVKDSQIIGAQGWMATDHYDIEAKPEDALVESQKGISPEHQHEQMMQMLQAMLADRFKLALHHETKELPIYALMVAKGGHKLHEAAPSKDDEEIPGPMRPDGPQPRHSIRMNGRGDLSISAESLDMFAEMLSRQTGRLVVNKTGLTGNYDFALKWTPDAGEGGMFKGPKQPGDGRSGDAPPPDAAGPSIFTALQEQLGLKLESQKGPVDTIVIDHVEKPSEN